MQRSLTDPRLVSKLHFSSRLVAIAVTVIALLALAGWLVDIESLRNILPGFIPMKFNTAVGFALSGLGLLFLHRNTGLTQALTVLVVLIGLLTLGQYLFDRNLGIDQLFAADITDVEYPGRMSVVTACNFVMIGSALLLLARTQRHAVAQLLALIVLCLSTTVLLGYIYGAEQLYRLFWLATVSLPTAISFVALAIGLLLAYPENGIIRVFTFISAGGYMARRFLPLLILIPIGMSWLRWQGERLGFYDTEFGLALFTLADILILSAVTLRIAVIIHRVDAQRKAAVDTIYKSNADLEDRIQERTKELVETNAALKEEVAQRKSAEELFRALLEAAPDAMVIVNQQGHIHLVNSQAEKVFGYTREQFMGRSIEMLIPEAFRENEPFQRRHFLTDTQVHVTQSDLELYALRNDGGRFPAEIRLNPVEAETENGFLVAVAIRDLTDRRVSDTAISHLAAIVETSQDAIISKNLDGTILTWNSGAQQLFGYEANEVIGKGIWILIPPDREHEEVHILESIRRGSGVQYYETVRRRKDGQLIDVWLTISPIRDVNGNIIGASKVARDITDRKKLEADLKKSNDYLQQTNEETQRFAYIVSHDLRAPLINLKGFSDLLRTSVNQLENISQEFLPMLNATDHQIWQTAMQDRIPTALRFINIAVDRMDQFTSAILELSRIGHRSLTYERVDVADLVQRILHSLNKQIEDNDIKIMVDPLPEVWADRLALDQIFSNLISNAIKFQDPHRKAEIRIYCEQNARHTTFHIEDNGRGISQMHYDKVFAPFRRGISDVEGEGMGLAYVRSLVRRHNGQIWFESTVDVGTTFSFTLLTPEERVYDVIQNSKDSPH
jgi:PAS domain S-box-containing protein